MQSSVKRGRPSGEYEEIDVETIPTGKLISWYLCDDGKTGRCATCKLCAYGREYISRLTGAKRKRIHDRRVKWTQERVDELAKLAAAGISISQAARKYGLSWNSVSAAAERNGIVFRKRGEKP